MWGGSLTAELCKILANVLVVVRYVLCFERCLQLRAACTGIVSGPFQIVLTNIFFAAGSLDLDQLVDYVAEVRKMDIVPVDEVYFCSFMQEHTRHTLFVVPRSSFNGGTSPTKCDESIRRTSYGACKTSS